MKLITLTLLAVGSLFIASCSCHGAKSEPVKKKCCGTCQTPVVNSYK